MIAVGRYNTLKILRDTSIGLYLGDDEGEDILLPNKYAPDSFSIGDELEVFVYRDHEQRKIATNLTPKILMKEFALLQVFSIDEVGAFVDWGLEKHLLVPFKEQRQRMEEGRWYVVYMDLDMETDRLYASNKIDKRLNNEILTVEEGQEVDLLIYQRTELGFLAIVNNVHRGLVFQNEVFSDIKIGDKLKGYVKKIREGNKLDLSLVPIGYKNSNDPNCEKIHEALTENDGFLALTDKSPPDQIYRVFGISKKAFKRALGALYKQRKISIESNGIRLV